MGLLGKTLKGRSTRPGGLPPKKNIKVRQIARTQDQFDNLKTLAKMKRDVLRSNIKNQHKIVNFNKRKLLTYWRKIMRIAKTEQLKNQIDIYSQNNQRQLDSNEAFIQVNRFNKMLDKNLDEAQQQYQIALRNHLIHIETLLSLQQARIKGLDKQFRRDVCIIEQQYDGQREQMQNIHSKHIKQLQDMIETIKQDDKQKQRILKGDRDTLREQVKNKNLEDINHMKLNLDGKQGRLYNDLQNMHQRYSADTGKKTQSHTKSYNQNNAKEKQIDKYIHSIANKKAKIDIYKLKILQHQKECKLRYTYLIRNQSLEKERLNISKNYQELKAKMTRFREQEERRLKELTNNSKNAVEKLRQYQALGVKILKTAQLCRRYQTQREKVIPFYQSSVQEGEIPQDLKSAFEDLSPEEYQQFNYLNNFYKRFNKVLLDKLAIQKQKQGLQKDNTMLKSLLKQYLDGISLNDQVMKSLNPLFIVNHKINLAQNQIVKENKTAIDGGEFVNNNLHQLGYIPRQGFQ